MRVELSEKAMYRRMDWEERIQVMIPISSMILCAGIMLAAAGTAVWIWLPALCGAGVLLFFCTLLYRKISGLIMPVSGCYLEICGTRFLLRQPFVNGLYESCCIELNEVESLAYDRRKSGFYLKIPLEGKSWIRDGMERKRRILYVSPFGYTRGQMEEAYEILKTRVPETTVI